MFVFGKIDKVGCGLGDHHRRSVGDLWASVAFFECVSIIMLQKVAAILGKVAADLCFRVSNMRLLLPEKYFEIAVSSAACLLCLYIL